MVITNNTLKALASFSLINAVVDESQQLSANKIKLTHSLGNVSVSRMTVSYDKYHTVYML